MSIASFIKGLFNGSETESAGQKSEKGGFVGNDSGRVVSLDDLTKFVNYVVTTLVDYPDEVSVISKTNENDEKVIWIACRKEDKGKIIGKKGKTIIAIRSLVAGAAGRMQNRVKVEVED